MKSSRKVHTKQKIYENPDQLPLSTILWLEQGRLIPDETESQPAEATPPLGTPKEGGVA